MRPSSPPFPAQLSPASSAQLASKEAALHLLRGELSSAKTALAEAETAAAQLRVRAAAAERTAEELSASHLQAPGRAPAAASTGSPSERALRSELAVYRQASEATEETERRLRAELRQAKLAHEAAEADAAGLADSAARVMTELTQQLSAEREARRAAEEALAEKGDADGVSGINVREAWQRLKSRVPPGAARGAAAGIACSLAMRLLPGVLSMLSGRLHDRTGEDVRALGGGEKAGRGRRRRPSAERLPKRSSVQLDDDEVPALPALSDKPPFWRL